ncbi:MAG TPA: NUDIX domain-containing protein [Rhabdochlamydiaceae bacterium]|nr:NUDIX domain-containing protein [Rhabdochlamydiaceae bacterium]
MIYINSFGVVPLRQEKGQWQVLLILHKEGNHWGFPKGKSNAGESPFDAAKRELLEETGLMIVRLLQDEPFSEQYCFRCRHQMISKTVSYFPAVVSGELKLQPEEIREGKWFAFHEALLMLTFKEARNILQTVINIVES